MGSSKGRANKPVERDGEVVQDQSLGAAPAVSSTGIEDGIEVLDEAEGRDTAMMSSKSTKGYMADASSRSLARKFNEKLRTVDRLQHGEVVDDEATSSTREQIRVDNPSLKPNPDSFVDVKQTHLEKLRSRGAFRITREMTMFETSISGHFMYSAAAQFLMMPNAHRLNPHGPMEGFGLFLIEETDYSVKKPLPANFIFTL